MNRMEPNQRIPYSFINEADVLETFDGDADQFHQQFAEFMTSYRFSNTDIAQLIQEKNYADARLLTQKIKEASSRLGITALRQAAEALAQSMDAEEAAEIADKHLLFSDTLEKMIEEITEI